jgi:hypothetical protein
VCFRIRHLGSLRRCAVRPGNAVVADEPHQLGQAGPRPVDPALDRPDLGPKGFDQKDAEAELAGAEVKDRS